MENLIKKTTLIYCVLYFNFGVLVHCLGGLSPPRPLVATGRLTTGILLIEICNKWLFAIV